METIRIFGGKSRPAEHAVDVAVEPVESAVESAPQVQTLLERLQPKRLALWAFLASLAMVILVTANYFMVRNEARAAELPPVPPPPRPAGPAVPRNPIEPAVEAKVEPPPPVVMPEPAPPPIRIGKADQPMEQPAPAQVAAAPAPAPPSPVSMPAPAPAPVPVASAQPPTSPKPFAVETSPPIIGKWYLQLGSLDKGVAEVIVQGLRARGMNAVWGPGITDRLGRVLVGPYDSLAEAELTRKQVQDLGFRPFAKYITPDDFKPKVSGTPEANAAIAESMRQQELQDQRERMQKQQQQGRK